MTLDRLLSCLLAVGEQQSEIIRALSVLQTATVYSFNLIITQNLNACHN